MPANKGRILYCEDHDDTRVLMTVLLERAGFEVTPAASGGECLVLAGSAGPFDLYLLDHTFPDASGLTVCESLRKFDAETPILFYSARALPQEQEAAMKAGAQDYLVKPNDLFGVADHVAKWITARRASTSPG